MSAPPQQPPPPQGTYMTPDGLLVGQMPYRMFDENSNAAAAATTVAAASSLAAAAASAPNANIVSQLFNVKDSRWLQVEVCREFLRGQCARSDQECKFAHPPPNVDVQQGRVTACYDSIKGRCTRENPKCKYLHPPQHIKDQLLINGRNHLALKNLLSAQLNSGGNQAAIVNPMAQIAMQQQAAASINMMPNAPLYPYYQGLVYSPVLQDPYTASLTQLQTAALLGNISGTAAGAGAGMLSAHAVAAAQQASMAAAAVAAASAGSATSTSQHQQQLHQQQSQHRINRKRGLEDDHIPTTSTSITDTNHLLLAAAAAGGVPCKRPTMDKNGTVVFQQAGGQPVQQFNPYLLQTLQGYVPTVPFSGQLPPRY
ncbi:unnamed protein product [Caenorhabditis angaria]|uniref:Muscleblind-like protein n=1 Tax=Caenorhabditis angaria TaxID=860376 RepID=A0A9P1J2C6_9PELO|nr:unnamed protein product [Caenorhabditis angaria]